MLHSTISQVADAEATREDINLSDIKLKLEKRLSNIPTIDDPFPFTLQMITIFKKDENTYYVDFDSLMRYIEYSDLDVVTVFNQLSEEYGVEKSKLCLVLPCKNKLLYAFNDYAACPASIGEKVLSKVSNLLSLIDQLESVGINCVFCD